MSKLIRITKSTPETKQLETFIKNLGCPEKPELFMHNNLVYVNADIIFAVLSVKLDWFIKNSEEHVYYKKSKTKYYVNKYGLIQILGRSKEAVVFKLIDYIFEVITKLETNG